MYDRGALLKNIEKCDENIEVFEKAIEEEMKTKKKLRTYIKINDEKEALKKEKANHVIIEA